MSCIITGGGYEYHSKWRETGEVWACVSVTEYGGGGGGGGGRARCRELVSPTQCRGGKGRGEFMSIIHLFTEGGRGRTHTYHSLGEGGY